MKLLRVARLIGLVLLAIGILLVGLWWSVAVWYRCTLESWHSALSGATALFALGCASAPVSRFRWIGLGVFAGCFALFLVWC
jgi:hypothetical protein